MRLRPEGNLRAHETWWERMGPSCAFSGAFAGVLLLPTHPTTASVHNLAIFRSMNAAWTALFNAMKTPVTSCPAGLSSEHVPLGLQIVGAQSNDGLTIRVAQELEKLGLRWIPPPVADLPAEQ